MTRARGPTKARAARKTNQKKASAEPKLSRLRRPDELSVEDWQIRLRRQFGREQSFLLQNLGNEPVFSEFAVTNPQSGGRYRVATAETASARISARARISPPTIWAPANISNSRWPASKPNAAVRRC